MSDIVDGMEQQTATTEGGQEPVNQEEQSQTVEIPDGKIGISPAEYRSLEGAEGFVPDDYVIVEEKTQQAEDEPGEPTQPPAEPTEQSAPPEEPTTPVEPTPEGIADFYGTPYQVIDGKPQVRMKVDGTEQFIDLQRVIDGFNFNEHNQRVAQDLARQRKEIEQMQETFNLIDRFGTDPASQNQDELDGMFDADGSDAQATPQGNDALLQEIQSLKEEVKRLQGGDAVQDPEGQGQAPAPESNPIMQELTLAYNEAKEICKKTGVFFPPEAEDGSNPQLVAAVKAAAENEGIDPLTIGKSPVRLVNLLKAKYKRVTENPTPDPSSTENPPVANSVQKTTPEIPELKKAKARLQKLREKNMEVDADHNQINSDIIATAKYIESLEKGT